MPKPKVKNELEFVLEWTEAASTWLARHPEWTITPLTAFDTLVRIARDGVLVYCHASPENQLKILLAIRDCYEFLKEEYPEPYFTPMSQMLFAPWAGVLAMEEMKAARN
jgi:hypothetical protein